MWENRDEQIGLTHPHSRWWVIGVTRITHECEWTRGEAIFRFAWYHFLRARFARPPLPACQEAVRKEKPVLSGPALTHVILFISPLSFMARLLKKPARCSVCILSPRPLRRGRQSPPRRPVQRAFPVVVPSRSIQRSPSRLVLDSPFPSCPGGDPVPSSLAHRSSLSPLQDHPSLPLLTLFYYRYCSSSRRLPGPPGLRSVHSADSLIHSRGRTRLIHRHTWFYLPPLQPQIRMSTCLPDIST